MPAHSLPTIADWSRVLRALVTIAADWMNRFEFIQTRLLYVIDGTRLQTWSRGRRHVSSSSNHLVTSASCGQLDLVGRIRSILSQYTTEFLPSDLLTLKPVQLMADDDCDVRQMINRSHVIMTTGDQVDSRQRQSTTAAVSFCTSMLLKTRYL